ncbi:MAG: hypothetical protein V4726_19050 [Verrucomicrobiota bacterium]
MILKSSSSLVLTAALCVSALGVLTDAGKPGPPAVAPRSAPAAEHAAARRALDGDLRRLSLTPLLASPEERRDRLMAWRDQNRAALGSQDVRCLTIQTLCARHHMPSPPGPLEMMAARSPKTLTEAASPKARLRAPE